MPSNFTKQAQYPLQPFFNAGSGDSVVGGTLTTVPTAVGASQGVQDRPGDRLVLGAADALALSSTAIGTLYGGIYMYVGTYASSSATPTLNKLAFWYPTDFSIATSNPSLDNLYVTTPDELGSGAGFPGIIAGVYINTLTKGNYWWIQIAGKGTFLYGANSGLQFAGTPTFAANQGVYAGGYGNTAGAGLVAPIKGTTFPTTQAELDQEANSYVGIAESNPGASAAVIVDMKPFLYRF